MRPFLALAAALVAPTPAPAAELDLGGRQQLMQLAQAMDDAWTAGDADANARLFAPDATARLGADPLAIGREAIRRQFDGFFKERPAGLRHVTKIERIEPLAGGLAMWDAQVSVERQQAQGQWVTLTRIRNITILVKQPDGWRIKAVRAFPLI